MTEEEYQRIVDRGQRAATLLEDPTLQECLKALEDDTLTRWRATHSRDIDGRETMYATLQGLEMFRAQMQSWVIAAKKAVSDVEKQRKREKADRPLRIVGGWRD